LLLGSGWDSLWPYNVRYSIPFHFAWKREPPHWWALIRETDDYHFDIKSFKTFGNIEIKFEIDLQINSAFPDNRFVSRSHVAARGNLYISSIDRTLFKTSLTMLPMAIAVGISMWVGLQPFPQVIAVDNSIAIESENPEKKDHCCQ
jgi:hypothetical protein